MLQLISNHGRSSRPIPFHPPVQWFLPWSYDSPSKCILRAKQNATTFRLHGSMLAKTTFMVFCKRSSGVSSLKSLGFSLQKRRT
jgi:hypothetical protein